VADTRIAQTIPDGLIKADPKTAGYLQSIEDAIKSAGTTASNAATAASVTALDARVTALENPSNPVTTFTTPDQTITVSTLLTIPHGLSATPTFFMSFLVCQTTDGAYSPGDTLVVANSTTFYCPAGLATTAAYTLGHTVYADATNVYIAYAPGFTTSTSQYLAVKKDATGVFLTTNSKWLLRVIASL